MTKLTPLEAARTASALPSRARARLLVHRSSARISWLGYLKCGRRTSSSSRLAMDKPWFRHASKMACLSPNSFKILRTRFGVTLHSPSQAYSICDLPAPVKRSNTAGYGIHSQTSVSIVPTAGRFQLILVSLTNWFSVMHAEEIVVNTGKY